MLKNLSFSKLAHRLKFVLPSKQKLFLHLRQGGIALVVMGGATLFGPPLWNAILVSPQQQVEPLKQRIAELDEQIKASPKPSTTDLKEVATLEKGRIDSENAIRTGLIQVVGGLLVFVTLYISWQNLKATQEKQVAERFSKAVEQLGNENIHVRLGGIYALEQIAKDAEEKYYWQVMEQLTFFVREESPSEVEPTSEESKEENPLRRDIQEVLAVLARREHTYGHRLEPHRLDLSNTDLRRLKLVSGAKLQGFNLLGVNLQEAKLWGADLQGADLKESKLQRVKLGKAKLKGAFLTKALLQQAVLTDADLQKVELSKANLQRANLKRADLQGAQLGDAQLQRTDLIEARLQNAWLVGSQLQESVLTGTNFQDAKLLETDLRNTIGLVPHQIKQAVGWERAILSDCLRQQLQSSQVEESRAPNQATENFQSLRGEIEPLQQEEARSSQQAAQEES